MPPPRPAVEAAGRRGRAPQIELHPQGRSRAQFYVQALAMDGHVLHVIIMPYIAITLDYVGHKARQTDRRTMFVYSIDVPGSYL